MPCLCASNTLRLFIRSVIQLDLPATKYLAPPRPLQKPSVESVSLALTFPRQMQSRRVSSTTQSRSIEAAPKTSSRESDAAGSVQRGNLDADSAFVDLSPDSINTIAAAESTSIVSYGYGDYPTDEITKDATVVESAKPRRPSTPRGNAYAEKELFFMGMSKNARRRLQRGTERESKASSSEANVKDAGTKSGLSRPRKLPISRVFRTVAGMGTRTSYAREPEQQRVQKEWTPPERESWQIYKAALKEKFPDGWKPLKRLSPDAMAGIRALHSQMPEKYTTQALAESFEVSPEMIRRILKSKWRPSAEEESDRQRRWFKRGENVWSRYAELGVKPPKRWRDIGIGNGKPEWKKSAEPKIVPALVTTRRKGGGVGIDRETGLGSLEDRIL